MQIHIYIYTCIYMQKESQRHNDKGRAMSSLEKYICTSHFIIRVRKGYSRFACERELETEHNYKILTPTLIAVSVVAFSFFWCSTGGPEAHSAGCGLSLPHLVTNGSPNTIGGPKGPFSREWLSLPHLISNFSGPQLNQGPRDPLQPCMAFPTTSRL